jgi:hypothetical protein
MEKLWPLGPGGSLVHPERVGQQPHRCWLEDTFLLEGRKSVAVFAGNPLPWVRTGLDRMEVSYCLPYCFSWKDGVAISLECLTFFLN